MKLSWHEKREKRIMIIANKRLASHLYKRPVADCFAGIPKKTISKNRVNIKFKHANVGLSTEDELDDVSAWVHEFTEHIIGRLILEMLIEEGLTLEQITDIICDGIITKSVDGGLYNPTVKHVMAALCTSSVVDGMETTPEEYAEMFGFKNGPVAQLDSAAPFEGVRCRFEFGRGLSDLYTSLKCKSCHHDYSLMDENEDEVWIKLKDFKEDPLVDVVKKMKGK